MYKTTLYVIIGLLATLVSLMFASFFSSVNEMIPLTMPIYKSVAPTPTPEPQAEIVRARISRYWPPLGGTNCSRFVNGECIAKMASGERWQDWIDKAVACPKEYPFWTVFILPGGEELVCLDRGGAIQTNSDGTIWLDILTPNEAPVPYGYGIDVEVRRQ